MVANDTNVLEERVRTLEKRTRFLAQSLTVLIALAVVFGFFVVINNMTAREAVIVHNSSGDAIAWMAEGLGSGTWIGLADAGGTMQAHLTAPLGSAYLSFVENGDPKDARLQLGWWDGDTLGMVVRDSEGRVRLALGTGPSGEPFFVSLDESGMRTELP